jgi:hypothetical protein
MYILSPEKKLLDFQLKMYIQWALSLRYLYKRFIEDVKKGFILFMDIDVYTHLSI